ncbi:helix-turn-helix domain-containing protein [Patulibacter sp. S7RM1-6]
MASSDPTSAALRRGRLRAGLTQQDAAERIGVAPNTVGRWERGQTAPHGRLLTKALEVYGLDMAYGERDGTAVDELRARVEALEAEVRELRQAVSGAAPTGR